LYSLKLFYNDKDTVTKQMPTILNIACFNIEILNIKELLSIKEFCQN